MFVIFAAIPTAPAAYVLTARMGGDARLVANTISAQTLACAVTSLICVKSHHSKKHHFYQHCSNF